MRGAEVAVPSREGRGERPAQQRLTSTEGSGAARRGGLLLAAARCRSPRSLPAARAIPIFLREGLFLSLELSTASPCQTRKRAARSPCARGRRGRKVGAGPRHLKPRRPEACRLRGARAPAPADPRRPRPRRAPRPSPARRPCRRENLELASAARWRQPARRPAAPGLLLPRRRPAAPRWARPAAGAAPVAPRPRRRAPLGELRRRGSGEGRVGAEPPAARNTGTLNFRVQLFLQTAEAALPLWRRRRWRRTGSPPPVLACFQEALWHPGARYLCWWPCLV